jgi:hypothetical protein
LKAAASFVKQWNLIKISIDYSLRTHHCHSLKLNGCFHDEISSELDIIIIYVNQTKTHCTSYWSILNQTSGQDSGLQTIGWVEKGWEIKPFHTAKFALSAWQIYFDKCMCLKAVLLAFQQNKIHEICQRKFGRVKGALMWVGSQMWSFPTQYFTEVNICNNPLSNLRITE